MLTTPVFLILTIPVSLVFPWRPPSAERDESEFPLARQLSAGPSIWPRPLSGLRQGLDSDASSSGFSNSHPQPDPQEGAGLQEGLEDGVGHLVAQEEEAGHLVAQEEGARLLVAQEEGEGHLVAQEVGAGHLVSQEVGAGLQAHRGEGVVPRGPPQLRGALRNLPRPSRRGR